MVADLSEANPNVYYELGLAHALHKLVIPVVASASELRFDLRGVQCIVYEGDIKKLHGRLQEDVKRILEMRSNIP